MYIIFVIKFKTVYFLVFLWYSSRVDGMIIILIKICFTWVHGGATREDSVAIQSWPHLKVTPHDGVVGGLINTTILLTQEGWVE